MNHSEIWRHIIDTNGINLRDNFPIITSRQIKESKHSWNGKKNQFEPRILCKMDFSNSRPMFFRVNNISLIGISKNKWLFTKNNIYFKLNKYHTCPRFVNRQTDSILLEYDNTSSESSLLDILYFNNIFSNIVGEEMKYKINSSRKTSNFVTNLNDIEITIKSQYEIDACYESDNFICIIEAKMNLDCNDFNLRQLYIPFMSTIVKLKSMNISKTVIPFFIYQDKNRIIHIHELKWRNIKNISSVDEISYYQYVI